MRTSAGWLMAAALCLGAASSAHGQGLAFTPFTSNGTQPQFTPFTANGQQIAQPFFGAFGGSSSATSSNSSQPTFPPSGASLAGPQRLINLMPNFSGHLVNNTRYIGYSVFPSQTDQYLSQFGFKRLR
ncbi:MAG TPA: hypothetical protein VMS17_33740 [Gemmataceae bacterium]|nr:hypothetical protein [Gemmataceae bacterium]